jgi:nitroimidazol reductase NimA-like FMN-containing flavoprotein (pyridoxamine 5'-phosphate oxidase superfamily)
VQSHSEWYPGHLQELTEQECRELLQQQRTGRVAWCGADGPTVLPVNYRFDDVGVLFRTSPHSELVRTLSPGPAAFQIDSFDDFLQSGWSVLLRGRAQFLEWDDLPDHDDRPEPWVAGTRSVYVRITAERITGRRVVPS